MHKQLPYLLALLVLIACVWARPCMAQSASCAASSIGNIQFSSVTLQSGATNVTGTISWTCTSAGVLNLLLSPQANIALCLNLNVGTGGTQANPRQLSNGTSTLNYQLYADAAMMTIWGSTTTPGTPLPIDIAVNIPAGVLFNTTLSGTTPFYAQLPGAQTTATVGTYTSTLIATASGSYNLNTGTQPTCTSGTHVLNTNTSSFTVTATVTKACLVTAGNINLGSVPSTATNTTATGSLNVTCSNGTPYFVGLSPSNNNTAGAGVMTGTISGNTNLVPYQLTSTAGSNGTIWGNTATSTTVGNGVAGTGSGLLQPIPVYVTAPSANFIPDTYSDTVTVNVNY